MSDSWVLAILVTIVAVGVVLQYVMAPRSQGGASDYPRDDG
ncbi:MAG: hypothetical protein ACJ79E_13315 [Anaeromyxobacteraceae bacterium]